MYNESAGSAVQPTPIIGALGVLENVQNHVTSAFKAEGDAIVLIGANTPWAEPESLAGSEALSALFDTTAGNPTIDLELETKVQSLARSLISLGIIKSAHDISHGGLAVAVAESAIQGNIGAIINYDGDINDWLANLFGEPQSRIILTCDATNVETILQTASTTNTPATQIGTAGGDDLKFANLINLPIQTAAHTWLNAFGWVAQGN